MDLAVEVDHVGGVELLFEVHVVVDHMLLDDPASLVEGVLVGLSLGSVEFVHGVVLAHENGLHLDGVNVLGQGLDGSDPDVDSILLLFVDSINVSDEYDESFVILHVLGHQLLELAHPHAFKFRGENVDDEYVDLPAEEIDNVGVDQSGGVDDLPLGRLLDWINIARHLDVHSAFVVLVANLVHGVLASVG